MKYGGKVKGQCGDYKAMLSRPGFWQAVEASTAWMGPVQSWCKFGQTSQSSAVLARPKPMFYK